jgi:hypothetical protein
VQEAYATADRLGAQPLAAEAAALARRARLDLVPAATGTGHAQQAKAGSYKLYAIGSNSKPTVTATITVT